MINDKELLSDITTHNKYARHMPDVGRRETWLELCARNKDMHVKKYPELISDIDWMYDNHIIPKKVLPSMRSLQFGGKAIELNNARVYNCAFMPIDNMHSFRCWIFCARSQRAEAASYIKTKLQ